MADTVILINRLVRHWPLSAFLGVNTMRKREPLGIC